MSDASENFAFTVDLYRLADWLEGCGVETVAMESTGVYWIPLFQVLEERGFDVKLVDPRRLKSVPGRKTDVVDCQWLQQLHTYGLLAGAFRPPEHIRELRSYLRQRSMLIKYASQHIQHMRREGADPDKPKATACSERHYWQDGYGHHPRHHRRGARPSGVGQAARLPEQGGRAAGERTPVIKTRLPWAHLAFSLTPLWDCDKFGTLKFRRPLRACFPSTLLVCITSTHAARISQTAFDHFTSSTLNSYHLAFSLTPLWDCDKFGSLKFRRPLRA